MKSTNQSSQLKLTDFENKTLLIVDDDDPLRGRLSSALHMLFGNKWKNYIEKTREN